MRTEIHDRQLTITALDAELAKNLSPNNELRSQKAGRLYAKVGPRHANGTSRSRLIYQAGGANYLRSSINLTLRERRVFHVDRMCKDIMGAARPSSEQRADEPNRYLVRHAMDMARIIRMADCPAARPLGFEAALEMTTEHWPHLSGLDRKGVDTWWAKAVAGKLAASRQEATLAVNSKTQALPEGNSEDGIHKNLFERKGTPETTPPQPSPVSNGIPQSAAAAQRQEQVQWHGRSPEQAAKDHKHGPQPNGAVPQGASPIGLWVDTSVGQTRASSIQVSSTASGPSVPATRHAAPSRTITVPSRPKGEGSTPEARRAFTRAQGHLNDILNGVDAAGLTGFIKREEAPHLLSLIRQRTDALTESASLPRDAQGQAQYSQAWLRLARFCGEACSDEGAGAHAFTRTEVMQLPLNHRLNMLEMLNVAAAKLGKVPAKSKASSPAELHATLHQQRGLMGAFTDAELLPPADEVRAKALKAKLQTITQRNPGGALTAASAQAVADAHREIYAATQAGVQVIAVPDLDEPFVLSSDLRTLQFSTAPRPAGEQPAAVLRALVAQLTRGYQAQLVQAWRNGALTDQDERFNLSLILTACQPRAVAQELLDSELDGPLSPSALTRHANLHAVMACGQ